MIRLTCTEVKALPLRVLMLFYNCLQGQHGVPRRETAKSLWNQILPRTICNKTLPLQRNNPADLLQYKLWHEGGHGAVRARAGFSGNWVHPELCGHRLSFEPLILREKSLPAFRRATGSFSRLTFRRAASEGWAVIQAQGIPAQSPWLEVNRSLPASRS